MAGCLWGKSVMNHVRNIFQVQFLFLELNELDLYKTVVLSVYTLVYVCHFFFIQTIIGIIKLGYQHSSLQSTVDFWKAE